MSQTIQLRRGTAAQWTTANSILASGEIGVETDTGKHKVGDGSSAWNTLNYIYATVTSVTALQATVAANTAAIAALGW
jgi:hypothetical protein